MKRIITAFALAVAFAVPVMGQAEVPTYVTKTASGTTTAAVYFATSPYQQARIVGAIASSDLSGANMTFRTGSTPLSIIKTNAAGTTIDVGATNGFAAGDWVVVETAAGVMTNGVIASFTGATNIVFLQSVCATLPGDQIYKLSSPVTLWVGVVTNRAFMGEAVYVGGRGRPVVVKVDGTSACSLDSITARYE